MRIRRNHRVTQRTGTSLIYGMRNAFVQHIKKKLTSYAPAVGPITFFLLAHVVSLLVFACIKMGILQGEHLVHKTIVTWAVFGFLPLLLSSYLCFYLVARQAVGVLARKFPHWSADILNLVSGAVYGTAIGLCLMLLRKPDIWSGTLLLLIGIGTGLGSWFFYRKLAGDEA